MFDPEQPCGDLGDPAAAGLDSLIERLEDGWRRGSPPSIEELLAGAVCVALIDRAVLVRELVLIEAEHRVRSGEQPCLQEYLCRFPELRVDGELAALLEAAQRRPNDAVAAGQADGNTPGSARHTILGSLSCELRSRPDRLGQFELRELVGSGSFGEVYRSRDTHLGRDVALKIPRRDRLAADEGGESFLREARHAARLRHPQIVPVFEAGKIDGIYYLACAYLPGGTLRGRLKEGPLPFRLSAEIVAEVAEALDYAHREGLVHRDVKPANILFDADGRPCLADFGLAKAAAPDATLTLQGARTGTPAFMSPEQLAGDNRRVEGRSDVYSLGVVLYELLTGQLPFLGRGRMLEIEVLHDDPRPPRRLDERVPVDLESICLKAMNKEPADRYLSAGAMADDLRRYRSGQPVLARPLGRGRRAVRWCRRRPALTGMAAALVVAMVAGFGGVTWQWRRAEAHLTESNLHRKRAERNFQQAYQTLADVTRLSTRDEFEGAVDPRPLRKELAELALGHYERFLQHEANSPELLEETINAYISMACIYTSSAGDRPKAIDSFRDALRVIETRLQTCAAANAPPLKSKQATTCYAVGHLLCDAGRFEDARAEIACGQRAAAELLAVQAESDDYRYVEIRGLIEMALVDCAAAQLERAVKAARQARELLGPLAGRCQGPSGRLVALAECYIDLASLGQRTHRLDEAVADHGQSLALLQRAASQDASSVSEQSWAKHDYLLGTIEWERHRPAEALAAHLRGCKRLEQLLRTQPNAWAASSLLASHVQCAARCWRDTNHPDEALRCFHRAAEIWQEVTAGFPDVEAFHGARGAALHCIGNLHRDRTEHEQAIDFYRQAILIRRMLCDRNSSAFLNHSDLSGTLYNLGEVLEALGKLDEALEAFQEAAEEEERVVGLRPNEAAPRKRLADRQTALVRVKSLIGRRSTVTAATAIDLIRLVRIGERDGELGTASS